MPTADEGAHHILSLFVRHFNSRPGEVLRLNNFNKTFNKHPWRSEDFKPGMAFAIDQGWIELLPGGGTFRLTEAGFEEGQEKAVDLDRECNEEVTIERTDGSRVPNVPARVGADMVLIANPQLPIAPGDTILRRLPSSLIERLVVSDPGFFAGDEDWPAHYQVKYRREGTAPEGANNHYYYMSGDNARVNNNSVDLSTNTVTHAPEDMAGLAAEMAKLREALLPKATGPEHYAAIGAVANAEMAAKSGDRSGMKAALSALGTAGKWALQTAKDIGVEVAALVISESVKG